MTPAKYFTNKIFNSRPRSGIFNFIIPSTSSLENKLQHSGSGEPHQTLTDLHGRHHTYLRISLTERCNLRSKPTMKLPFNTPILKSLNQQFLRQYSTSELPNLSHIDAEGHARMVNVSYKPITHRTAIAKAHVNIPDTLVRAIKENSLKKGDVLSVSQIAGIAAAKKTSELLPLCHNISLSSIVVNARLDEANKKVELVATVECDGKTGVEMEALTAVSVAALNVYDMCKAVSREVVITDICLVNKTGGSKSSKDNKLKIRPLDTTPIEPNYAVQVGIV